MADEPRDEPINDTPPDDTKDIPAWITPEGRLRVMPVKKLHDGEEYTQEELQKLRDYWTDEWTHGVAEWLKAGAPDHPDLLPRCVIPVPGEWQTSYDLRGIDLSSHLAQPMTESAELGGSHLEHAQLSHAHLERAYLDGAHLERSMLSEAHLQGASMCHAHLQHAYLFKTHLNRASLPGAYLDHAVLVCTSIVDANLAFALVHETRFADVTWRDQRGRRPKAEHVSGLDVRGLRNSDPLFDQFVRQSSFIWSCRDTWWNPWRRLAERLRRATRSSPGAQSAADRPAKRAPWRRGVADKISHWPPPLWLLWKVTCNCGRSFVRWAASCLVVAVAFGLIYWQGVAWVPSATHSLLTYVYHSIVTFATLGSSGDIVPTGDAGRFWVVFEVILAYMGLGGLISIFTTKLIPPQ